jgi:protein-disulfide isomerase
MKNHKEKVPVIPSKDIVIGEASAPVTLIMFGDYESEATAKANAVVTKLLEEYSGKIKLIYRHFPLTRIHQKAHKAAEAAIGAAQEGKFWEMHQCLIKHRQSLGVISLKSYAREAGVKDKRFLERLINSEYGWFVQDDLREGLKLGVVDVPTFFINGELFDREPTFGGFKNYLDQLLKERNKVESKTKERKRA